MMLYSKQRAAHVHNIVTGYSKIQKQIKLNTSTDSYNINHSGFWTRPLLMTHKATTRQSTTPAILHWIALYFRKPLDVISLHCSCNTSQALLFLKEWAVETLYHAHIPWGVWVLFWKCCIVIDCAMQHVLISVADREHACGCSYKNSWIKVSKSATSKTLTLMQSCSFSCSFLHLTLVNKCLNASSTWHFCGSFSEPFLMLLLHNGPCIST